MPATQAVRRKAVVDEFADGLLAQQDADAQAREAEQQESREARTRRAKTLEQARKGEAAYVAAAQEFQGGIRQAMHGLKAMLQAGLEIMKMPGTATVLSKAAILTRCSRWLGAELFGAARNGDYFGTTRLHYTGRPAPGSGFVDAERDLVGRIFIVNEEMEE